MDFGFTIPTRGPLANPDAISALARRGEELGFGFLAVSDHVIIPNSIRSLYPYSPTGEFGTDGSCMDQLTLLSFLAGITTRIGLLSSVMVLPHRNPLLAAKMLATVDVLSGGRLTVGCGVGWMREEFEVLEAPPYEERGLVGDEYIRAFRELWTSDSPAFDGRHVNFSDVTFAPKPVQQPHPPIWIGGESPPALRRVGRLGDAWYPIGSNPKFTIRTPAQYAEAVDRIHSHAEEAGRDPGNIDLAYSVAGTAVPASSVAPTERRPFTGAPSDVAADIASFREVGVRHMRIGLEADCLSEMLDNLEAFAADVMPLVSEAEEKR